MRNSSVQFHSVVTVSCAEPRKPGPPTNLTEGDTLIMGDKVAVTLHWFPPIHSDLPVSRYKATLASLSLSLSLSLCVNFDFVPIVILCRDMDTSNSYFLLIKVYVKRQIFGFLELTVIISINKSYSTDATNYLLLQ